MLELISYFCCEFEVVSLCVDIVMYKIVCVIVVLQVCLQVMLDDICEVVLLVLLYCCCCKFFEQIGMDEDKLDDLVNQVCQFELLQL